MLPNHSSFSDLLVPQLLQHGVDWEVVYAFKRTGLLITKENVGDATKEQLNSYSCAVREFRELASKTLTTAQ